MAALLLVVFVVGRFANGHNDPPKQRQAGCRHVCRHTERSGRRLPLCPSNVSSIRTRDGGKSCGERGPIDADLFAVFGRVTKLLVKPGDTVDAATAVHHEAADMVQAQNDFIVVLTAMNKARAQLKLSEIVEKRHRDLYK